MAREDGYFKKGNKLGGRPVEHPLKGKVAKSIWDALVTLSAMKREDAEKKMKGNPTMAYIMAWKYITENTTECIDRMCGRIPNKSEVTGNEGAPLIPPTPPVQKFDMSKLSKEQLDKFIEKLKP